MRSSLMAASLESIKLSIKTDIIKISSAYHHKNSSYLAILQNIANILTGNGRSTDEDKIRSALEFIQNLKCRSDSVFELFQSSEPFQDYLKTQSRLILTGLKNQHSVTTTLSNAQKNNLAAIYRQLIELIPIWRYQFSKNANGEIINNPIKEWQKKQMDTKAVNSAINDFTRSVTIQHKNCDINSFDKFIDDFVRQAPAYQQEEKSKLSEWLKNHGGQDNSRFIDLCFNSGCMSTTGNKFSIGMTDSANAIQNWDINANGKICFQYDIYIKTISRYGESMSGSYIKHTNGDVDFIKDPEEIIEIEKKRDIAPLMRIDAAIELNLIDGKVAPSVIKFNVYSHADNKLIFINPTFARQENSEEKKLFLKPGNTFN